MSKSHWSIKPALAIFLICLGGCADVLLDPRRESRVARPGLVETVRLPDGQSLLRLDFEDARVERYWTPAYGDLDRASYAEQGILIDSARVERATPWYNFGRSGSTWLSPQWYYLAGNVGHRPPLRISFNANAPGAAKAVRVHVAHFYYFALDPEQGAGRLTCYSGASVVGTQSVVLAIPPYGDLTPEYSPLEVSGDSITSCTVTMAQYVIMDDIEVVFQEENTELELQCTPNPITRGASIQCSASAKPGGTLTDIRWVFEDTAGQRVIGPPDSVEWRGTMVVGGRIHVSALLNGQPAADETTIEVVDRTWPEVPRMEVEVLGASDGDPDVPALQARLIWASDLGTFTAFLTPGPGEQWDDAIQNVVGGPNDGLDYFADLSFPVRGRIRINHEAMSSGSGFYRAQERNHTGSGTLVGGTRWCSARVVTSTLPSLVRAHEERHAVVYREKFAEVVRAELPALERMTGSYSDLADAYDALRVRADSVAISASLDIHKLRGNPDAITASENGQDCNLKNESGRLLEDKP